MHYYKTVSQYIDIAIHNRKKEIFFYSVLIVYFLIARGVKNMGNDNLDNNPLIAAIFGNEAARKPQENEYINKKDGFIYCSICKKPKQSRSGGFLHPMQCECERKEREEAEAEENKYKHRQAVKKRKADCFGSNSKYADCTFTNCDNGVNTKIAEFCYNYCVN